MCNPSAPEDLKQIKYTDDKGNGDYQLKLYMQVL
jgi:hypothetical protein